MRLVNGVCRYCGCTNDEPCRLGNGDQCGRARTDGTLCTGPRCVTQYDKDLWKERRQDYLNAKRRAAAMWQRRRKKRKG